MDVFEILLLAHPGEFLGVSNEDLLGAPSFIFLLELLLVCSSLALCLLGGSISLLTSLDDAHESCALFASSILHFERDLEACSAALGGCGP